MKKICLATYVRSPNYGAALQLYATYKALSELGCDVTIMNYQNPFESDKLSLRYLFSHVGFKEKARQYISSYIFGVKQNAKRNFEPFYQKMKYSARIVSIDEIGNLGDFDVFCVGSDQVWNPRITDGFDDVFILNSSIPRRKISYASSMGSCDIEGYPEEKFIESIKQFSSISVREKIACDFLSEKIQKPIKQVVDPTFLLSSDDWNQVINKINSKKVCNGKYVLVYALGGYFEKNRLLANKVAKKIGAKVVAITLSNRPKKVDKIVNNATPIDFVRIIRDASFVVTNSFHGTCFSLIMGTPFYSVRFGDNPARAEELLAAYGLQERLFREGDKIKPIHLKNNDLVAVKKKIDENARDAKEWLENAIYG